MAFGNLTVDFRQLARVPVRDRAALAQSAQASEIFGNLTPSQIATLFPDYYKKFIPQGGGGGGSMAAGLTGAGSTSTATSTTSTAPTTRPGYPGFIQNIIGDVKPPGGQQQMGSNISKGQKRLMELIASGEGGYNSSNGGTKNGNILYSTHSAVRNGKSLQDMTIGEIEKYMQLPLGHPERLFAVGKYQLTSNGAWPGAVRELRLKPTDVYTPELQEKMGLHAIMEKRPAVGKYVRGESDDILEAQKQLALEFASIPVPVGMTVKGKFRPAGASAYGDGNRSSHNIEAVREALVQARQDNLAQNQETGPSATLPGTAPITGQAPQGSDAQIQNLRGTQADQSTAVVAAPRGPAKTMILSLGTNDFGDPSKTYQNTIDAINEGRKKGYNVVVVPPVGNNDRFKAAYDEVMRAVNETGASVEQPQSYSSDGYHPTAGEYKRIGEKYQGAVVVGDSIAVGIGQYTQNGQTVATEGIRTDAILSKIRSEQIAQLDTAQVSPQTTAFDPSVFAQLDPRIKEEYNKASDELKRQIETAIAQKGVAGINKIMEKYPMSTATAVSASIDEVGANVIERQQEVAGVRRGRITSELKQSMSYAAEIASDDKYQVILDVTSGGQRMEGAEGATGSHRHDEGGAADFNGLLVDRKTNERILLDPRKDEHRPYIQKLTTSFARVHPSAGVGALYMDDPTKIHFGGDDVSEHGGRARGPLAYDGPDWFREAHGQGVQQREQDLKEGRDVAKEWLQKKLEAQTAQVEAAPVQTLPGTQPITQEPRPDDTAQIPLQQSTANTAPAMKLGGEMDFKEPNTVKESMSLVANGKEVAQFNKNENVNVEDGKIKVQNEYDKKTKEAQQKNDKGAPQANQYNMRQSPANEMPRTFPDQVKYGIVPQSPSAKRQFDTAQFGGYDHFSRRSHSS